MATSQISHLKRLRTKAGLTQQALAARLGVPKADVAAWERDLSRASVSQLKDMAIVLDVYVDTIRGAETPYEEVEESPFAVHTSRGAAYGTLKLTFAGAPSEYPIDEPSRVALLTQLSGWEPQEGGDSTRWLYATTLNNLVLYANSDYLKQVELISDDAEQMPGFEHPEVYNELESWDLRGHEEVGPVLLRRCEEVIESVGEEEAIQRARAARILTPDDHVSWHMMISSEDVLGFHLLELEAGEGIPRNSFIRTVTEGYHRELYVNLSQTALIEVPANCLLRLHASGLFEGIEGAST